MSVIRIECPNKFCFSGNRIELKVVADTSEDQRIDIEVDGKSVIVLTSSPYLENGLYISEFEISDILQTLYSDIFIQEGIIIKPLDNFRVKYKLYRLDEQLLRTEIFEGYAFKGGINNRNMERLQYFKMDMFSYRLRDQKNQFLFTTRTNSRQLRLRQNELFPFVFIHPGVNISFVTIGGKVIVPEIYDADTVCTMDINAVRKMFYDLYQIMPAYIAVMVDGKFCFDITLLPGRISHEKYFLLFRNSIGGYEKIEVTGRGENNVEFLDEDAWKSPGIGGILESQRNRLLSKSGMTVDTGFKSEDELYFILDMIKSEEIYFIDPSAAAGTIPARCLVNTEKFTVPRKITEPQSLSLKISFVTEESFESPGIVFEPAQPLLQNITTPGAPQWNGDGLIYSDDYILYSE